jgi:prepilin-type processing-associated H-X9-DG protein
LASALADLRAGPPLPITPGGSISINEVAAISDDGDETVVFVHGVPTHWYRSHDQTGARMAMAHLVEIGAARSTEVAAAFGVHRCTVYRARQAYREQGVEGLLEGRRGPKGSWKVDEADRERMVQLSNEGLSLRQIGRRVGVSHVSVYHHLDQIEQQRADAAPHDVDQEPTPEHELPAVPEPQPRAVERGMARFGMIEQAPVELTEGRALPSLGVLLAVPALVQTGLIETAQACYGQLRNGFYGLRSVLMTLALITLLREPHPEGLTRLAPQDLGRLLGLDRAPEVKTLRRKLREMAARGCSAEWIEALARQHADSHQEAMGFLYVDGHVRVYGGKRKLAKHHVARMRLSLPATLDTWVNDAEGEPVLVWASVPNATLVSEVRDAMGRTREVVGDRRVTVVFDRGGWSPDLFATMDGLDFDFITYRKGSYEQLPASAFETVQFKIDGSKVKYDLADRGTYVKASSKRLRLREVRRRTDTGHQTAIITSRWDLPAEVVAYRMFERWRQENFFRYGRQHFALDAMHDYDTVADDPDRTVPNPERKQLDKQVAQASRRLDKLQQRVGAIASATDDPETEQLDELFARLDAAEAELQQLTEQRGHVPTRVQIRDLKRPPVRLADEVKRITDAIKIAAYRAETSLLRLLSPHYARAEQEGRSLLREAFRTSGDLRVCDGAVEITLDNLSAPRRTRALGQACELLSDANIPFPGTDLLLRFTTRNEDL